MQHRRSIHVHASIDKAEEASAAQQMLPQPGGRQLHPSSAEVLMMEAEVQTTEESANSSGCNQLWDVREHLCAGLICDEPEKMKNFQDPLLESNHVPAKTACAVGASVYFENGGGTFQNWPSNTLTPPRLGSLVLAAHKENEHEVIMSIFLLAQLGEYLRRGWG